MSPMQLLINIVIGILVAGLLFLAARKAYRDAKEGRCACGSAKGACGTCKSSSCKPPTQIKLKK